MWDSWTFSKTYFNSGHVGTEDGDPQHWYWLKANTCKSKANNHKSSPSTNSQNYQSQANSETPKASQDNTSPTLKVTYPKEYRGVSIGIGESSTIDQEKTLGTPSSLTIVRATDNTVEFVRRVGDSSKSKNKVNIHQPHRVSELDHTSGNKTLTIQ
ncbi:hypothetical protein ACH5RR_020882 [Cinchona calisaya]|uniref:Uncharacterized protein n=1 Tax=Cinchona calisaya TaxID=153742 RepID=A0ABD2ZFU6_9GENT